MKFSRYLIVRADGTARVVARRPQGMRLDEVAFRVGIVVPDGWARISNAPEVTLVLPEPLDIEVEDEA